MSANICGGGAADEVEDFHSNLLRHELNAEVELGLTTGHSLELELRFR